MKVSLAVALIIFALVWLLFISMFYGDSVMTIDHTELYSGVCFLMIFVAIYLIYSHNRKKNA
jgi:ABC-type nickel/cobalt efflux system permease component RcnA